MQSHAAVFRRYLIDCDVAGVRALWAHVRPHLPQPANNYEALATIHHARTQTHNIALKLRAYSHRWLLDHNLPSGLPDGLKPRAERLYPKIAEGVGLMALTQAPHSPLLRRVQIDKVCEIYADTPRHHSPDPVVVKREHLAARAKERAKLWLPRSAEA